MMNMLMRQISELETAIVSVERVKEYADTPNEVEKRERREKEK